MNFLFEKSSPSHFGMFCILMFSSLLFITSCASESDQIDAAEIQLTFEASDFEGEWMTSSTYSEYENAVMRINASEGDEISGRLHYQQRTGPGDETNPASRYFFNGAFVANAMEIRILTEGGDEVGNARLTLRNGELHVQMLNRQDRLPEIFVLEPSEE
ncbi:MAG: hypothetical protein LAT84_10775 [Balneolia bacterium]|nr:hypothetical protein [Balneolia bacterium]